MSVPREAFRQSHPTFRRLRRGRPRVLQGTFLRAAPGSPWTLRRLRESPMGRTWTISKGFRSARRGSWTLAQRHRSATRRGWTVVQTPRIAGSKKSSERLHSFDRRSETIRGRQHSSHRLVPVTGGRPKTEDRRSAELGQSSKGLRSARRGAWTSAARRERRADPDRQQDELGQLPENLGCRFCGSFERLHSCPRRSASIGGSPHFSFLRLESESSLNVFLYSVSIGSEPTTRTTWVRLFEDFAARWPGDRGVLSPLILHLHELRPGEAIHTGPGILHAYLQGVGMELMTSSDNVLRGGLTAKHVDVPELLDVLRFEPLEPRPLRPAFAAGGRAVRGRRAGARRARSRRRFRRARRWTRQRQGDGGPAQAPKG